ncbi:hypothetical protein DRO69_00380 [Candidatus Bathyarchaeota archaeon]|nr:MAG: hypothetical protein DRO69_00380 [Candidatus Bathyarchaeota archaeon]
MSLDVVEKCPWKLGDCCTYLNSWPPCNPDEDWCPLNEEYYDWLKQEQSEKFKIDLLIFPPGPKKEVDRFE